MRRLLLGAAMLSLCVSPLRAQGAAPNAAQQPAAAAPKIDWNTRTPWAAKTAARDGVEPTKSIRPPFKIFDNVYYVGLHFVSSYLVTTSAGLVLIDATYAQTADNVLDGVRKLGFNPSDIKYILVTHSHLDHFGGAGRIHEVTGARVGLSLEDWQSVVKQQSGANKQNLGIPLTQDLILKDNSSITLGDTTFKFYFTPGHSVGATSIEFQARDRGKSYRTLVPGGMGLQFGPEWTAVYIQSNERLKQLGPWDVVLPNHPFQGPRDVELDIEKDLATRGDGPHPAVVGPAVINDWFDAVLKVANEKLAIERGTEKPAGY